MRCSRVRCACHERFRRGRPKLQHTPDTVVVESPLPGGAATFVRFIFNEIPSWLQIGGAAIGMITAIAFAIVVFRRRQRITSWVRAQSRPIQFAVVTTLVLVVAGAATGGAVSWNYMQHDNDFCIGCHVQAVR